MYSGVMPLLLVAMLGCAPPTPEPLVELDEAEFNLRYATRTCRREARCGTLGDFGHDSEEACVETIIAFWEAGKSALADICPEATYSPIQAAACLDFSENSGGSCEWGTVLCTQMEWYQDSCKISITCYLSEEGCM